MKSRTETEVVMKLWEVLGDCSGKIRRFMEIRSKLVYNLAKGKSETGTI